MIVDLFAGPGGWDVGARSLGLPDPIGLEWDAAACETRAAAGLPTIRTDVAAYPAERFHGAVGLIASPPCQDFSVGGLRAGRTGAKGRLVDEVPRWVEAVQPRWVACEQVPPVLPIWQEFSVRLRQLGYSTWCGVVNAADYGVPQRRKRALLLASLDRHVSGPRPTHSRNASSLFMDVQPWVSMAEAIGWGIINEPALTLAPGTGKGGASDGLLSGGVGSRKAYQRAYDEHRWVSKHARVGFPRRADRDSPDTYRARDTAPVTGPALALTTRIVTGISIVTGEHREPLEMFEAGVLQGFPHDYPWRSTKTKQAEQIGNAIPPPLAAAALSVVAT